MRKIQAFLILLSFIVFIPVASAQNQNNSTEKFVAKVIEITEEKQVERENNSKYTQQKLKLNAVDGSLKDQDFIFNGITDLDIPSTDVYKVGDKVVVTKTVGVDNQNIIFINGFYRTTHIYILGLIFSIVIILVGRKKGFRSLLSLILSFVIITQFIVPRIISGSNPLTTALIGSIVILGLIIYITDGINKKTNVAAISVVISLTITFIISLLFVKLTRLTGMSSEEAGFLVNIPNGNILDFRGLLMAGILIGTVGVLDDAILGQIEVVEQVRKLNPNLERLKMIKVASEVGRAHLGAIVNTLFLTYAGASLPILILFSLSGPQVTLGLTLSNEMIATEIIRTLAGSIGIALCFPITTFLGVYYLKDDNIDE